MNLSKEDQLLEEAKIKYPIGTKYIMTTGSVEYVANVDPYFTSGSNKCIAVLDGGGLVYDDGKWAEVVSAPKKEGPKFKHDYQIDDRVTTEHGKGRVCHLKIGSGSGVELIGVEHDEWTDGHSCDGYCEEDKGYWFTAENIEKIEPKKKPKVKPKAKKKETWEEECIKYGMVKEPGMTQSANCSECRYTDNCSKAPHHEEGIPCPAEQGYHYPPKYKPEQDSNCTNGNGYGLNPYREGCIQDCDECDYNSENHKEEDQGMDYKVGDTVITEGYSDDYDGKELTITRMSGEYCYFTPCEQASHNFSVDDIVKKVEKKSTLSESKDFPKLNEAHGYKVGDRVEVTNTGQRYSNYDTAFIAMGFKNKKKNDHCVLGDKGEIFAISKHPDHSIIMFGIDFGSYQALMGHSGIKKVETETPLSGSMVGYSGPVTTDFSGEVTLGSSLGDLVSMPSDQFRDKLNQAMFNHIPFPNPVLHHEDWVAIYGDMGNDGGFSITKKAVEDKDGILPIDMHEKKESKVVMPSHIDDGGIIRI